MRIEIGGQQWSIEKVNAHHPGLFCDGDSCSGTTWNGSAEIYLSNELKGDQVARVVTHELTHAYIYSTQAVRPEQYTEEDICELVAIYAWEIAVLTQEVCRELYPDIKTRSWSTIQKEARL